MFTLSLFPGPWTRHLWWHLRYVECYFFFFTSACCKYNYQCIKVTAPCLTCHVPQCFYHSSDTWCSVNYYWMCCSNKTSLLQVIFYAGVTDYEREVWSTGQQRYWFVILRWVEVLMGSGQLGLVQCCGHSRAVSGAAPYLACPVMSPILLLSMAWKQRVCFDVSGNGGAEHLSQLGLLPARLNSGEKKKGFWEIDF